MQDDYTHSNFSSVERKHAWRDGRDPELVQSFLHHLEARGFLDRPACDRIAAVHSQTAQRIDLIISQLGVVSDSALMQELANFCSLQVVSLQAQPTEMILSDQLSSEFLHRNHAIPFSIVGDRLQLAVADPFAHDLADAVAYFIGKPVDLALAAPRDIETALTRVYGVSTTTSDTALAINTNTDATAFEEDVQRLRDMASEAPIIRLVNRLIAAAVLRGASDIHIEPYYDAVRVRYRIDGVMQEIERLPPDTQAGVATRVKILGKLNIAERRLPQDGRIKFVVAGREVDLRISTTPIMHGESLVLRILDAEQVDLTFGALGFDVAMQSKLTTMLAQPNGIILVTGPTGSGKTTTLYAALRLLNTVERKVFTVEDPIEYKLAGVNQMQIKPEIGLDFVHCLRSILRQDPDVIMIGEMRDTETASTAIRAALTGHLVLSTLHTNSAAASITRLLDMGAEDYLLASSLVGVLAQRLVRRLCGKCSEADPDAQGLGRKLFDELGIHEDRFVGSALRRPVGCEACGNSGFRGRTAVHELLPVDSELRPSIKRGVSDREIEAIACSRGMHTLYQSGLFKVLAGETTIEEILKVARA